jgi:flagellar biosynthetic protein FliR
MDALSTLSAIPFPSAAETLYFFYIFMRVLGLLLVSPLLSNRAINPIIRFFLSIFITIILAMVLYPNYLGPTPRYLLKEKHLLHPAGFLPIILTSIIELVVGYIIGFCFNVVFEAMNMAGELVDAMIGFSTAQFLDPFSYTFHSMLGQLLVIFGALFMLAVDFHHIFIRVVADSFFVIPIGLAQMTQPLFEDIAMGTSWIFVYAIKYGAMPLIVLGYGLIGISFTIRVVPEMNLLLTGLPMRILIGLLMMALTVGKVIPIFEQSFMAVTRLAERIIIHMAG